MAITSLRFDITTLVRSMYRECPYVYGFLPGLMVRDARRLDLRSGHRERERRRAPTTKPDPGLGSAQARGRGFIRNGSALPMGTHHEGGESRIAATAAVAPMELGRFWRASRGGSRIAQSRAKARDCSIQATS